METFLGALVAVYDWLNDNSLAIIPLLTFWYFQRLGRGAQNRVVQANAYLQHVNVHDENINRADFDKLGMLANLMRYAAEIVEMLRIVSAAAVAILVYFLLYALQ